MTLLYGQWGAASPCLQPEGWPPVARRPLEALKLCHGKVQQGDRRTEDRRWRQEWPAGQGLQRTKTPVQCLEKNASKQTLILQIPLSELWPTKRRDNIS